MATKSKTQGKKQVLRFSFYFQLVLSLVLIVAGLSILFFGVLRGGSPSVFSPQENNSELFVAPKNFSKPSKLYIPAISKVLTVTDGTAVDNRWVISPTGVSFYTASSVPEADGNTVLYGHNTEQILGRLLRVREGDYVYVVLDSGNFVKYQVYERKEVKPEQVEILNQTADSILTIYTCSGFLDEARYVVVAKRISHLN